MKTRMVIYGLSVALLATLFLAGVTSAQSNDDPIAVTPTGTSVPDPPPDSHLPEPTATEEPTATPEPTPTPSDIVNPTSPDEQHENAGIPGTTGGAFETSSCGNIVSHLATPIRVLQCEGYIAFYWVGDDEVRKGPEFPSVSAIQYADKTTLYEGIHPGTNKPVSIVYFPSGPSLRIETFYADNMYDVNKPYIFEIDGGNNVSHVAW